jgi:hypothetical protein
MSLHLELGAHIESTLSEALAAAPEQKQDALIVHLRNGVMLHIRYAAPDAYSLRWIRDGREAGIDTAPLHPDLATFPNHLHDTSGHPHPDPFTRTDATPEENVQTLIRALLDDPSLGTPPAR